MNEGFAHEVQIKKLDLTRQSGGQYIKFLECHSVLITCGLRTEHTAKVTYIRYLKIASGYHIAKFKHGMYGLNTPYYDLS